MHITFRFMEDLEKAKRLSLETCKREEENRAFLSTTGAIAKPKGRIKFFQILYTCTFGQSSLYSLSAFFSLL